MFSLDLKVINVTKEAIWAREAVIAGEDRVFDAEVPREVLQEQFVRDLVIDPKLYYPADACRK